MGRFTKPLLFFWVCLLGLSMSSDLQSPAQVDHSYPVARPVCRLLIDQAHGRPFLPNAGLTRDDYDYWDMHNWQRLARHLQGLGVSVDVLRKGPLSPKLLQSYQLVLMDVPLDSGQDFAPPEVQALEDWVRQGGGLMVYTEHSNIDHSADRVNRLLQRFGIRALRTTAMDHKNVFAFEGWHKLRDITEHPVTRGIKSVAIVCGGCLELQGGHPDRPIALMRTSPNCFQDDWNPTAIGFIGDLTKQENEPTGACVELAAATPGIGRVVVIADHNTMGNVFLYYLDDFALALQSWAWLSRDRLSLPAPRRLQGEVAPTYDGRERGFSILMPDVVEPSTVMTPHSYREGVCGRAYFTLMAALNRDPQVIARCTDRLEGPYDMILLPPEPWKIGRAGMAYLHQCVSAGGALTVLVDADEGLARGSRQVLAEFLSAADLEALERELPPFKLPQRTKGRVVIEASGLSIPTTLSYYRLNSIGRPLVSLRDSQGSYPVIIEFPARETGRRDVTVFLQNHLVRNDGFQTASGRLLGTGPLRPDASGMDVFRMLWWWLEKCREHSL